MSKAKDGWHKHAYAPAYPFDPTGIKLGLGIAACPEGDDWIYIRAPRWERRFGPAFISEDFDYWRHKRGTKNLWEPNQAKIQMYESFLQNRRDESRYTRISQAMWESALAEAKHPTERRYPKGTLYRTEEAVPHHLRFDPGVPSPGALERHRQMQERIAIGGSENIVEITKWKGKLT